MKKLLLFISLFPFPSYAATPTALGIVTNTNATGNGSGLIPLESLSGTGTTAVFTLSTGDMNANLAANGYYPFYKNGNNPTGFAPYQVSSGKTAYCFNMTAMSSIGHGDWQLLSASNSFAFNGTPTGVIYYQAGAANKMVNVLSGGTFTMEPIPGTFQFSQNYFPGIQVATASEYVVRLDCYEK